MAPKDIVRAISIRSPSYVIVKIQLLLKTFALSANQFIWKNNEI